MEFNKLMMHFAKANLEFDGIYRVVVPAGKKVVSQSTTEGVCGFVFPIHGKAKYTVDNIDYYLEAGTILHAGSKMDLSKEVIGEECWEYILFHYKVLQEVPKKDSLLNMNFSIDILLEEQKGILDSLEQLIELDKQPGIQNAITMKSYIYHFLSKLFHPTETKEERIHRDRIELALEYIHSNLDQNLTISELADIFHYNAKQFSYLFQKKTGISPKKYIMQMQIKKAKELLSDTNYSISEIANCIGYEDSLHFSRIFKQNIGTSPSDFRNQFGKSPY